MTSFWIGDILWFGLSLFGVLFLISERLKLSDIGALEGLLVATMCQVV